MLRERTISRSDAFPLNYIIIIMPGTYLSWNESKKMENYNFRAQFSHSHMLAEELSFSKAIYVTGQKPDRIEVGFGLSENSLEAYLSKKRRA